MSLSCCCYFCCCVSFFFWDITYKGENMVFVLLRLFHLAWCPLSILLSQMARFLSFYVWITLHYMSVHIHMCMRAHTHTHHIFSKHSFISVHINCFHIMAIVNNAAVSIAALLTIHPFEPVSLFISDKYPEVKSMNYITDLLLIWREPPYCFLQWLQKFSFTLTVHEGSFFPHFHHLLCLISW